MSPLVVLLAVGGGLLLLGNRKSTATPAKPATVAKIPTPAGPITVTKALPQPTSTQAPSVPPVSIPPIKVTLPTPDDYGTKPPSGDVSPMLTQSETYAFENYSNDQLYNEAMSSGHLAYVAAAGTKLAASGDTRAMDLTLRVANWGK